MPVVVGSTTSVSWAAGVAAETTLAVTKPDGSVVAPAPATTGTDTTYSAQLAVDVPGRWLLRWSQAGGAVFVDVLNVWPADPRYLVALTQVTARTGQTVEDVQLAIAAATWMIEKLVGPVLPAQKSWRHHCRSDSLVLPDTGVSSVTGTQGGVPFPIDPVNVDDEAGIVYGLPTSGVVRVSYSVGGTDVPADLQLAAIRIATHLVQQTRNVGDPGARTPMDDQVRTPFGFALPAAAYELCQPHMRAGGFA